MMKKIIFEIGDDRCDTTRFVLGSRIGFAGAVEGHVIEEACSVEFMSRQPRRPQTTPYAKVMLQDVIA
jgi:hypothetical protein